MQVKLITTMRYKTSSEHRYVVYGKFVKSRKIKKIRKNKSEDRKETISFFYFFFELKKN